MGAVHSQSLSVINNTSCTLRYSIGVSMDMECWDVCYKEQYIPPMTTMLWPNTGMADWNCGAKIYYWYSFDPGFGEKLEVGSCKGMTSFSPPVFVDSCNIYVEYSWQVSPGTKNVEVLIREVKQDIPANLTKSERIYAPKGGTAMFINTMLGINMTGKNTLAVQTNVGCIAGVYTTEGNLVQNVSLEQLPGIGGYEICYMPASGSALQHIQPVCFCSMEKVFSINNVKARNTGQVFVYTISQQ